MLACYAVVASRRRKAQSAILRAMGENGLARANEAGLAARAEHHGFRILARRQGERVKIWSRRGADFT
jgi:hypothetical protein